MTRHPVPRYPRNCERPRRRNHGNACESGDWRAFAAGRSGGRLESGVFGHDSSKRSADRINTSWSKDTNFLRAKWGNQRGNPNGCSGCHWALRAAWRFNPLHGLAAAHIRRTPNLRAFQRRLGAAKALDMFASAKQKIERANYHIADLERQFAIFVSEKPNRFSIKTDPTSGALSLAIRFTKELPRSFAPIISDAIHNLRTALDHAAWEVVGLDHGTQDRHLQFPTGDNRINFEATCNGIKTPSQWVKDAFKATEAFIGGKGMDLYQLSQLDNSDKHVEITPVLRTTGHPAFHVVAPDGRVVRTMESNALTPAATGTTVVTLATFQPGFSVELDDDAKCPPSIFFSHPGGFISSPAIVTLRRYSAKVDETIATIESAVP